jgi:hypothetical protein
VFFVCFFEALVNPILLSFYPSILSFYAFFLSRYVFLSFAEKSADVFSQGEQQDAYSKFEDGHQSTETV